MLIGPPSHRPDERAGLPTPAVTLQGGGGACMGGVSSEEEEGNHLPLSQAGIAD